MNFDEIIRTRALSSSSVACLVLVHPEIRMLEKAQAVIEHLQIPVAFIGEELSALLLDTQRSDQARAIARWFDARFTSADSSRQAGGQLVAFSQIDFLFEPCFQLDPLALFKRAARNNRILVLWPGDITHNTLSYAVPEHRHYRTWRIDDPTLQIIRLQE